MNTILQVGGSRVWLARPGSQLEADPSPLVYIQCLLALPQLSGPLLQQREFTVGPSSTPSRLLFHAYAELVRQAWGNTEATGPLNPSAFKRQLGAWAPFFLGYEQQDAQEFLRSLLCGLHEGASWQHEEHLQAPSGRHRPQST